MGNAKSTEEGNESFLKSTAKLLGSNAICGNILDAFDDDPKNPKGKKSRDKGPTAGMILPGELCHSSKSTPHIGSYDDTVYSVDETTGQRKINPTSALFARALMSEVTDNPRTMTPMEMAAREKRLLKAQDRARKQRGGISALSGVSPMGGGLNLSFTNNAASGADVDAQNGGTQRAAVLPPNQLSENRAQLGGSDLAQEGEMRRGKHTITIGLSLSRRHSTQGHPDTVTRQTAFDFNELQDRAYKYVSSTDSSGWRAGGGEKGGNPAGPPLSPAPMDDMDGDISVNGGHAPTAAAHKVAAPDTVHIPIIEIDAASPAAVDQIISALARGEVFIPHMSILPEALSVNGVSPPDLVVRFGCERNDDLPPDEWPNWCLEFMHNQLYEYFMNAGARWTKRPFQITLAKKVRWRTVKHMNKFFAHSERVINAWREKGPQHLNPQLSYIEGGATPEEVARPHGIYLLRNGRPTNYFAPNFEPPYTTKMTRSLLMNVIGNSWDKKRRDWTSEPIPRLVTPAMLIATVCGCGDGGTTGFIASEETMEQQNEMMRESLLKGKIGEVVNNVTEQQKSKQQQQDAVFRSKDGFREGEKDESSFRRNPSKSSIGSDSHFQSIASQQRSSFTGNMDTPSVTSSASAEVKNNGMSVKKTMSGASLDNNESKGFHVLQERQPVHSKSSRSSSPNEEMLDSFVGDEDDEDTIDRGSDRYFMEDNAKGRPRNSPPPSEGGTSMGFTGSVGESATTVPMSNRLAMLKDKEGREKDKAIAKRLGELEDALKKQHVQSFDQSEDLEDTEEEQSKEKTKSSKTKKKEKKEKEKREKKEKRRKEKEKQKQMATKEQSTSSRNGISRDSPPPMSNTSRRMPPSPGIKQSPSNHSLDYSMDSATINSGNYTIDGGMSVGTAGTAGTAGNQSLLSYVTRSTIHSPESGEETLHQQQLEKILHEGDEDDDDENDSLIASETSAEEVPSDADLFAIGWAKALDANSGSYYYFTLDRSKIVWENPLLANEEDNEDDKTPIPARTFSSETESFKAAGGGEI